MQFTQYSPFFNNKTPIAFFCTAPLIPFLAFHSSFKDSVTYYLLSIQFKWAKKKADYFTC